MARPKEFEPEAALAKAVELFRERGYNGTSTADLVAAMGISRGSLFATFGTKDELFFAALCAYQERLFGPIIAALDAATRHPAAAIRQVLLGIADRAADPSQDIGGCLVVNTTMERAPHDPRIAEYLDRSWTRLQEAVARAITRGQANGTIASTPSAAALARYLITVVRGIGVGARLPSPAASDPRETVEIALRVLGPS